MSESRDKVKAEAAEPGSPAVPEDEGVVLAWSCHPMRRKPWLTVGVTVFIGIVGVLIQDWTGSRWFAAFGVAVLFMSLAKFYLPTQYRLSNRRITVKTTTQTMHREWSVFRSFYPDKNGVLLSPFAGPSRLENFRGLYLLFADNRDDVVAFVKERLAVTAAAAPQKAEPPGSVATKEEGQ